MQEDNKYLKEELEVAEKSHQEIAGKLALTNKELKIIKRKSENQHISIVKKDEIIVDLE